MDKPAANDRFWLRHALGGLAAVGLVGWLMLQHAAWWSGPDAGSGSSEAWPSLPSLRNRAGCGRRLHRAPAIASAPVAADAVQPVRFRRLNPGRADSSGAAGAAYPGCAGVGHCAAIRGCASLQRGSGSKQSTVSPGAFPELDAAQPAAPAADAVAPQNSRLSAQLPLCPLQTEKRPVGKRNRGADKGSGTARNPRIAVRESPNNCRQSSLSLVKMLRKM
jgi:hypothetical protein